MTLPTIIDAVPHRFPSLLLDELLEADETHAVARVTITEQSLYFEGTGVPAIVTLEYMAQTVAAYSGTQRRRMGEPTQLGFLLGCRRLTLEVETLRAGEELRIEARHIWSAPPLGQFECRVLRGEQTIANATLSVYEGPLEKASDSMKPRALITGGSRGIGAAIAEALAEAGHPIVLNYRSNHSAAEAVKGRIVAAGGQVELCAFDVSDAAASRTAIEKLLQDPNPIGVLVNNAGIARDAPFPTLEPEAWNSVMQTTLGGFYNVTRPLVMPMVSRRWGRIINVTSVSGVVGNRGQVNYSAAKAGLIGATKALAQEVAKRGVTVNAVAPGLIETDMIKDAPLDQILPHIPMRRLGQAREVADLVAFLASDKAGYITAQVIGIGGGLG